LLCPDQEFEELATRAEASMRLIDFIPLEEVEGIDFEVHPKTFVRAPSGKDNFVRSPSGRNNLVRTPSDEERSTVSKEREGHHQVTRVCWQEGAKRSQSVLPEQMHDGAYIVAERCLSHQLNLITSRLTYLCWPASEATDFGSPEKRQRR
jgi:hypothetical protein